MDIKEQAFEVEIPADFSGQRLDKVLSHLLAEHFTRARLQSLIKQGQVKQGDAVVKQASGKVLGGEKFIINVPEIIEAEPQAENIPLNIVYEDDDLLVIDKHAGLVVHPAAGNWQGTLVNALLAHCGDSLSGIGGVKRPGIVHRLDKDTTGLMVVAKNDKAHQSLSRQLKKRTLRRIYHAFVWGIPTNRAGTIATKIGRHPRTRQKMAVLSEESQAGKEAVTHYEVLKVFVPLGSLVECRLETGRTHQIRVHMAHIGNGLIADPLYGQGWIPSSRLKNNTDLKTIIQRQALHAAEISFIHPSTDEEMVFTSPLPQDLQELQNRLENIIL